MGARWFGAAVKRVEDPKFQTGRGRNVADIALPGMVHAAFVRASFAHAVIKRIDTGPASSLPGVVGVYGMADFGAAFADRCMPETHPHPLIKQPIRQFPLARDEVCHVGEPVAIVLAESRHLAEDAAGLVEVDYEPLDAVVDCRHALDAGAPPAHRGAPNNLIATVATRFGDVEQAFRTAAHVFRERHEQHRGVPHSMECRGVIASHDAALDQLTIWSSTQAPYQIRRHLARYLERDESSLRVIAPDVGGGFGPKGVFYAEEVAVALAALKSGRPVKWIEDRREHFYATTHQRDQIWDMEVAAAGDGRILGLRGRVLHDNGAYVNYGLLLPMTSIVPFPGPYAIPNIEVVLDVVFTNTTPTTPVRGAGRPNAAFTIERLVDRVAQELKLDPAEVRRRNFIQPDQFPYETGAKARDGSAISYDSGDYPACLEKALADADYAGFPARRAAARGQGRYLGIGIASYVEDTGLAPYEGATVRVLPSGKVVVKTGAASQGQGHQTVFAQICADQLGIAVDQVIVQAADTDGFPLGIGTVASRVAVTGGSSVHQAAAQVRAKALKQAAAELEVAEDDLVIEDGVIHVAGVPELKVGLGALALRLAGAAGAPIPGGLEPGLEATAYFNVTQATYANGTNLAEVEVDIETGEVRLLRYTVAHDCGRLINPLLVEGQIVGGVVHGIGNALFERMIYDEAGQPLTTNLGEYLLPLATEMPPIAVGHIESPSPRNPLGIKGAGEGGTIPAPAAVIAAVEDALTEFGLRITDYPIDPQRLVALIDEARGA